jgi:hypothetical protein
LSRKPLNEVDTLVRYHEILLFLRAYPHNSRIVELTESELAAFADRVDKLRTLEPDLSAMETPEVSGIAGTSVTDSFTYPIVSWLQRHQPGRLDINWEWTEDEYALASTWPRFMPILVEDASVEANVPYQLWFKQAAGRQRPLDWLVARFESLPKSEKEKAELYDSQKLYVRWTPAYRSSRTGMRAATSKTFFHREPLIQRREVSFAEELAKPSPPLKLLSPKQGEAMLDLAREASTVRYRELYGFTHGDPRRVLKATLGRGVDLVVAGIPSERRLPLRAYHAAMMFKNGIAVGYFEGLSLFERMESGFNLYYTFRDGETAWLYARTLNVFRHLAGVTAFAIDPYQIGHENEEGIESGAFWFYRKLGFRPTRPEIVDRMSREETRLKKQTGYRTSLASLRKLAAGPMIFELGRQSRDWDHFQVRNIGLRIQQRMAETYDGDAGRMRVESAAMASRLLDIDLAQAKNAEVLSDFLVALMMIPDLKNWTSSEKQNLGRVIRAKANADEAEYLKLMQRHSRLREAFLMLGSEPDDPRTNTK